jgi:hypothetical protein
MSHLHHRRESHGFRATGGRLIRAASMLAMGATVLGQTAPAEEPTGKKIFRAGAATSNVTPSGIAPLRPEG